MWIVVWTRRGREYKYETMERRKAVEFAKMLVDEGINEDVRLYRVLEDGYKLIKIYN